MRVCFPELKHVWRVCAWVTELRGHGAAAGFSFLWSSGAPRRLLRQRLQFAAMDGILGEEGCWWNLCLVILQQYCSLHTIWALMPKIPPLPEAEASQVCLHSRRAGSCWEDRGRRSSPAGTPGRGLAGGGRARLWVGHCLCKAKDCEMDRSEEFVLHVILN